MIEGMIGRKVGMTQIFLEDGTVAPVTVIEAGPCVVVQRRVAAKDGYEAVQLGFVDAKAAKRANKATRGHHEKAGVPPTRLLREFAHRRGLDAQARRQGARGHLRGRGQGRRDRDVQGEGVPGRHAAAQLRRRRRKPRLDVPPRSRIDRLVGVSVARVQGDARSRAHGKRPRHGQEPEGDPRRQGQQPAHAPRRRSRRRGHGARASQVEDREARASKN